MHSLHDINHFNLDMNHQDLQILKFHNHPDINHKHQNLKVTLCQQETQ
jgi:hypothetical protein